MGKQQHVADGRRVGQQHDQPVYAYALARRRRHAVFQGADVVVVKVHGLGIAGIAGRHLLMKTLGLVFGVVELGKAVGNLPAGNDQLKTIGKIGVIVAATRQGDTSTGYLVTKVGSISASSTSSSNSAMSRPPQPHEGSA